MSEKVKVPKEIAEAIEKFRHYDVTDFGIIANLIKDMGAPLELEKPINRLMKYTHGSDGDNANKLLDALRIGYEVEEEWKEGDWVVNLVSNEVGKVTEIRNVNGVLGDPTRIIVEGIFCYPQSLRHATEQEIAQEKNRRFWSEIGRQPNEYREGDLAKLNNEIREVNYIEDDKKVGFKGLLHLYKPCEVTLVCPAEDRLDQ